MIILDTNVLSAVMQKRADPAVVAWLDSVPAESVWISSVTLFEVRFGLQILPVSRRRHDLEAAFEALLDEDLDGRVLPLDDAAAEAAASIAAQQRRAGRPVEIRDVEIGGIALARKATLATRNVRHFEGWGVSIADPWSAR